MKNLGFSKISLILTIISFTLVFLFDSSLGLLLYLAALILAITDLVKFYKSENLTPRDFFEIIFKERIGSAITVILLIVAIILL